MTTDSDAYIHTSGQSSLDTGAKDLLGAFVTFLQPLILGEGKEIATLFDNSKIH